jgi:hypothetical protein
MNQLYPIVRRVRRPFLPVDALAAPAAAPPQAAPPQAPVTDPEPSPATSPAPALVSVGEALEQASEKPVLRKKTRTR